MYKKIIVITISLLLVLASFGVLTVGANGLMADSLVQVSGTSPFSEGCNGAPQSGDVYLNSEVEPWVAVNPADPDNIVGAWQQDRWSTGAPTAWYQRIPQMVARIGHRLQSQTSLPVPGPAGKVVTNARLILGSPLRLMVIFTTSAYPLMTPTLITPYW